MKITFIISSLSSGGAERVLTTMANYWSEKGFSISIITIGSGDSFYAVNNNIAVYPLNVHEASRNAISALVNNYKRVNILKKQLKDINPDLIISFMTQTNIISQ